MNLKNEDVEKYNKLKDAVFNSGSLQNISLSTLADQLNIHYHTALAWFSHMLKHYAAQKPNEPLCPSCGKIKDQSNNPTPCRDVFHYL